MTIKQHSSTRLAWDAVGGGMFQAGGLARHFEIARTATDKFALRARTGDEPSIFVGVFSSLDQAKFRAQRILDQGVGK